MKTGFKDPIAPKGNSKGMKSPFNFEAPHYDERSSCYVNAGGHFGVGHRQPVGNHRNAKDKVEILPAGRVKTMEVSKIPHRDLKLEIGE